MANYWIDLFTKSTWDQFIAAGASVTGFRGNLGRVAQQISKGDYLLCYVVGLRRWIGVLQVSSDPYEDHTRIWSEDLFPWRVKVTVQARLAPETAVPLQRFRGELTIFGNNADPRSVGNYLRRSPTRLTPEDGRTLVAAIVEAARLAGEAERLTVPQTGALPQPEAAEVGRVKRDIVDGLRHEALFNHLQRFHSAPILFVGSGMARRYLGLPTWEALLRRFAQATGRPYEYFASSANGNLPAVATLMAQVFHEIWWTSSDFAESREKFKVECSGPESALKIEIAAYIRERSSEQMDDPQLADEIALLRMAVVDAVITTNWDTLLEDLFPDFHVFTGQDELIFSDPLAVGELYKIHGSCVSPNSLVLTANDYENFHSRNPYLAAKLLTAFVEHPVLFLGYSLSDPNVVAILRSIASCLTTASINKLRDRLIFIRWEASSPESDLIPTEMVLPDSLPLPILTLQVANFSGVFRSLANLPRKFPARLLRRLKEHVYRLVLENDPQDRLYVQELSSSADMSTVDVVFGVGTIDKIQKTGYRGLRRIDLITDLLRDDLGLDSRLVVSDALPDILRGPRLVPAFKHLRRAGFLTDSGDLRTDHGALDVRVIQLVKEAENRCKPAASYQKKAKSVLSGFSSIATLVQERSVADVFWYGCLIPPELVNPDELKEFLVQNWTYLESPKTSTQFWKLACYYDMLTYRWAASSDQ